METKCERVYFGQLLFRTIGPFHIKNMEQQVFYNNIVRMVNKVVAESLNAMDRSEPTKLMLWYHKGLKYPQVGIAGWDGTHLNNKGQAKYMHSVRQAVRHARNARAVSQQGQVN